MPLPGNRITLLETGDDFFPALETAIDGAVAEVHLETYIFADDPTGRRIADALVRAAQRGVVVRLMVDGFGSSNLRPPLRRRLAAGGTKMRILVYRPERGLLWFKRGRLRRLHRKLAVIDGRIGFCGGINIHDDRDGRGEGEPRFDYAVRVEGPLVADMQDVMQRLWRLVRWTTLGKRTGFPLVRPRRGKPFDDGIAAAFVIRDNVRNRGAIEEEYLDAIRRARREVIICNAYFLPGRRIRHALRDAVRRGVRVRLLLQGKREYFWVHYASRALYGSL
ncbi:MAG: cardiolipin synthase ClsB, partial [Burkholderiales bacterium]|nr:cardiolipin synthase ClsB [Burkholderiales bacterium]